MPFMMEDQKQPNWCWAAVAVSVERYFSGSSSSWTQCKLASHVLAQPLGNPDCCADPAVCNKAWYLQDALSAVGKLRDKLGRVLSFEEIETEKQAYLPVCVRIGWYGGGGHFVVIYGCGRSASGQKFVHVADSWYLDSTLTYEDFVSRYQHQGKWTGTYRVQP